LSCAPTVKYAIILYFKVTSVWRQFCSFKFICSCSFVRQKYHGQFPVKIHDMSNQVQVPEIKDCQKIPTDITILFVIVVWELCWNRRCGPHVVIPNCNFSCFFISRDLYSQGTFNNNNKVTLVNKTHLSNFCKIFGSIHAAAKCFMENRTLVLYQAYYAICRDLQSFIICVLFVCL